MRNTSLIQRGVNSMWTRAELKASAKKVLSASYWYCVFITIMFMGISMIALYFIRYIPFLSYGYFLIFLFLIFPMCTGINYFYLCNRIKAPEVENVSYAFNGSRYLKIVWANAWMILFIFLWFIIPLAGLVFVFIKTISYSMTPFILAENSNIDFRRILKLSISMTNGYKGDIFKLCLSFIGWALLATVTLGIGWIFLAPYMSATYTELYVKLRDNAIANGVITGRELQEKPHGL